MAKRKITPNRDETLFWTAADANTRTYYRYVQRLTDLALSIFEWRNLPETVNERYIEMALFHNGCAIYFQDEIIGDLCLDCLTAGSFNVYGDPVSRRAYSKYNNYQRELYQNDSVIIWNNYLHTNCILDIKSFALRLSKLDRIIDVNTNAQKTPILIQASEKQRLTMLNLYQKYEGNEPYIFGDNSLDLNSIKVLSTNAPYISDKIYELKTKIWNEALTYLGISNLAVSKKERLISDEVQRLQGGTIASRFSRLESRREAAEKINRMFGTNIEVVYRGDQDRTDQTTDTEEEGGGVYE